MILGIVSGHLNSTIGHEFYRGRTILVVDRCGPDFTPTGGQIVAIDSVGAGVGQRVLVLDEGNGARQVVGDARAPVRSVIVGIVDDVRV